MVERAGVTNGRSSAQPANGAAPGEGVEAAQLPPQRSRAWLAFALGAAVFASLAAILGKVGVEDVDSSLGTAIRTVVVLVMAWIVVWLTGEGTQIRSVPSRDLLFIALSGVATGASWLCYWRAMQEGPVSVVAPIDKLSVLVTAGLAYIFFGERLTRRATLGLAIVVAGTLLMLL